MQPWPFGSYLNDSNLEINNYSILQNSIEPALGNLYPDPATNNFK